MLTKEQIFWALRHDWAIDGDPSEGWLLVRDAYCIDGEWTDVERQWTGSFSQLKAWAGY